MVPAAEIPIALHDDMRVRVIAGTYRDRSSPTPVPQLVTMLDVTAIGPSRRFDFSMPRNSNALIIPIGGTVGYDGDRAIQLGQALACSNGDFTETLTLEPEERAHFILLSGPNDPSPVITNGPFVYAALTDLRAAELRYQQGRFGRCPPIEEFA